MAQQEAAKMLANLLSKVARYSVVLGVGASALQASLYTGAYPTHMRARPEPRGPGEAPGCLIWADAGPERRVGGPPWVW